MRIKYKKKDLYRSYELIVSSAQNSLIQGKISDTIKLIKCAAEYQYNINCIFTDDRLDYLLIQLSNLLVINSDNYHAIQDNVILYDSFVWDNRGLTQQYLDALSNAKKYNIILVHNTCYSDKSKKTIEYCNKHNIPTIELGTGSYEDRQNILIRTIESFKPEKVLFHLYPSDILPLSTFYAYKQITKYQINLTDHAFWLGTRLIDYSFEFRNQGANISLKKRNLNCSQLLLLPYYPWTEDSPFRGFPSDTDGKVKLFSGGSFYKYEGGDGAFLRIVKKILDENPNVVFLLAGDGYRENFERFVHDNHFERRFFLIGNRPDINQVMKNIDIYINSYPMIGGLMSQYAAINGKPILTYKDRSVEDVICIKFYKKLAIDDMDELCIEANKLIRDEKYRRAQGKMIREMIINQYEFRNAFSFAFNHNASPNTITDMDIYESFYESYLNRINDGKNGLFLERLLQNNCPQALHWKMSFNLYLERIKHKLHIVRLRITGRK